MKENLSPVTETPQRTRVVSANDKEIIIDSDPDSDLDVEVHEIYVRIESKNTPLQT